MLQKLLHLQFFVLVIALLKCSVCWEENGENEVYQNATEEWSNNNPEDDNVITASNGAKYKAFRTNELGIFSKKSDVDDHYFYSCINFNPDNHECNVLNLQWLKLNSPNFDGQNIIRKIDMVFTTPIIEHTTRQYYYDVSIYGFPMTYFIHNDSSIFKMTLIKDFAIHEYPGGSSFSAEVTVIDEEDQCKEYRPHGRLTGADTMSISVYMTQKDEPYSTYPYLLIKKESNICVYRFDFTQFISADNQVSPEKFYIIDNYPTEEYAPNFFAVDPLYGTFVSLFWDKIDGHPPEAHFFAFNENQPEIIEKIDNFILTGFDEEILKDIFSESYDDDSVPTFKSFGRQIFVSFKRKDASEVYSCLWKNETEFTPMNRRYDNFTKLWHVRRDYIQFWKPVKPYESNYERPLTTTVDATTTSTTTKSAVNESNIEYENENQAAGGKEKQKNSGNFFNCTGFPQSWHTILLFVADALLLCTLIILIIFGHCCKQQKKPKHGRKKGKKRRGKKSKHRSKGSPIFLREVHRNVPFAENVTKKKKKRTKDCTNTRTNDQTSEDNRMTTGQQTKYYTCD